MFGESTFQICFDGNDDSEGEVQFFDSNQDLAAALDRLHKATSSAMDKQRPAIPVPIVLDAEEPIPTSSSPILVETVDEELPIRPPASPLVCPPREQPVDELPFRPPARPIVYPPRESPSPSPRDEYSPTSSREYTVPVSWRGPIDEACPHREVKQEESVPTRAIQLSNPSILRRSTQSNLGQGPNRLNQDRSDTVNLGKGPSREAVANLMSSSKDSLSLASRSSDIAGESPSLAIRSSGIANAYEQVPSLAPRSNDIANVFLVANQPGLSAVYAMNGITQSYAFKASNSDPDTLSYDEAMADVDRKLWIAAAKKEMASLEDNGTWTEVELAEATSRILPRQWVFQCKRTPDGNVKSHKARMVARKDLEQGVFQTFAPAVAWSTVRLFLVLSLVLDW